MIKLSIIIPVYNIENYIGDCIESILPQLNPNVELILVDDGSTDNSAAKIKRYMSNEFNIKYYYQENQRQGAARNLGLKNAVGKYLWIGLPILHGQKCLN